jgi:hypothetical protein
MDPRRVWAAETQRLVALLKLESVGPAAPPKILTVPTVRQEAIHRFPREKRGFRKIF